MQTSVGSWGIARLIGAFAALSLSAGSAWAGGSNDLGSVQATLDNICTALNVTPCPQLPTATQLVLEIAGLESAPPEVARFENTIVPTLAINAVNPPAGPLPFALSNVSPLAFTSPLTGGGVATVTQPDDPLANSFFYAATNHVKGVPPDTLSLVYDYPPLTNPNFAKDQFVAEISVPLVVLNSDGTEREVPTIIEIRGATGCKTVPCVSATASGDFGNGLSAANLGLTVTLVFQPSPNSTTPHAIFAVQAPLLVTKSNDPAYFASDPAYASDPFKTFLLPAFVNDELGVKFSGLHLGIAPYAAPKCTSISCPPQPPPPAPPVLGSSNFPLCASIALAPGALAGAPAVAAFFSIGTVGTTYLSAPKVTPVGVSCPF